MTSRPQWHHEPDDVQQRLAHIGGLTVEILREAAVQGELGRANCTSNHPPLAGPYNAWADTTRSLRDQLLPRGWTKSDDRNFALTISPDGRHCIVVATGDENTGSVVLEPRTRSRKGPRTHASVTANAWQLSLFEVIEDEGVRAAIMARDRESPSSLTWVLLVSRRDDELRVELSLPVGVGEDGRPGRWPERIILPPIQLDGPERPTIPESGPDIEVDVTRRTA